VSKISTLGLSQPEESCGKICLYRLDALEKDVAGLKNMLESVNRSLWVAAGTLLLALATALFNLTVVRSSAAQQQIYQQGNHK
jgi:hypothetical protein